MEVELKVWAAALHIFRQKASNSSVAVSTHLGMMGIRSLWRKFVIEGISWG